MDKRWMLVLAIAVIVALGGLTLVFGLMLVGILEMGDNIDQGAIVSLLSMVTGVGLGALSGALGRLLTPGNEPEITEQSAIRIVEKMADSVAQHHHHQEQVLESLRKPVPRA